MLKESWREFCGWTFSSMPHGNARTKNSLRVVGKQRGLPFILIKQNEIACFTLYAHDRRPLLKTWVSDDGFVSMESQGNLRVFDPQAAISSDLLADIFILCGKVPDLHATAVASSDGFAECYAVSIGNFSRAVVSIDRRSRICRSISVLTKPGSSPRLTYVPRSYQALSAGLRIYTLWQRGSEKIEIQSIEFHAKIYAGEIDLPARHGLKS